MPTTIRKNAFGKIANILAGCEFIRCSKFDDMSDDGCLTCVVCRNWIYTAYPTLERAVDGLTDHARARYNLNARIAAKREAAQLLKGYSRPLITPQTTQDGLANCLQAIINYLEAGDTNEAILQAVDLLDDVRSKANPYRIGLAKARKPQVVSMAGCGNID